MGFWKPVLESVVKALGMLIAFWSTRELNGNNNNTDSSINDTVDSTGGYPYSSGDPNYDAAYYDRGSYQDE